MADTLDVQRLKRRVELLQGSLAAAESALKNVAQLADAIVGQIDESASAPWCSCKGVVAEVGKCDGACAVIPGWEDRARFRSDTSSQGDER
jgi:hypothetical protein